MNEGSQMAVNREGLDQADSRPDVYEAPRLTPIGNLRDLLAGGNSFECDQGELMPGPDAAGPPTGPNPSGCPGGGG